MELKVGYQRTDVGVIPREWRVRRLGDLVASGPKNGYSGQTGLDTRGTPTLRLTATSSGYLILNDETVKRLDRTINPNSDLFLDSGDVLIQRSNTPDLVGTTAIFDGPPGIYVYPDLMMRVRFRDPTTAHWFWGYANSAGGRRFFQSVAAGSSGSMPKISGAKLREMLVPLPTPPEQRAIAAALSDIDALTGALDRLVAKKRDLKQSAMQQLLTGKRRLPGFGSGTTRYKNTDMGRVPEDWSAARLGDGVSLLSGHHVLARYCNIKGVGVPYITGPADFTNGIIRCSKFTEHPATLCEPGDVLVTVKGSGAGKVVLSDGQYCISRQLMAVRANRWAGRFVYYCLLACGPQLEMATTGLIPGLSRPDILGRLMAIPSLPEQTAIGGVLADMDAEIAALERRRDKTRLLKQGMMQELLTGRIRLV